MISDSNQTRMVRRDLDDMMRATCRVLGFEPVADTRHGDPAHKQWVEDEIAKAEKVKGDTNGV